MDALLLAVLNALWQGAVLIALVALGLRAGLRRNATTACVVWSITFLVVALLPALDLALARPAMPPPAPSIARTDRIVASTSRRAMNAPAPLATGTVSAPRMSTALPANASQLATDVIGPGRIFIGERVRESAMRIGSAATAFARVWGIALFGAWALVAGALLLRLARGYAAVALMKRASTPLDDPLVLARLRDAGHRRRATVARSHLVDVPCAVGFRKPMILIPTRLAESLDGDDLARVVLHESAHLQRYDDWLNALEQVVCALQFFQPALHVARRGIDFEREVACDDRVLEDAGEPLRYAECLARIVSRSVRGPRVAVAPGFVVRRAQVVGRVRRIVDRSRDTSPHLRFAAVGLTAVVFAATLGIARLQVPVVAAASAATPVADPAQPAAPARPIAAKAAAAPVRAYTVRAPHAVVHVPAPRPALAAKPAHTAVTAVRRSTNVVNVVSVKNAMNVTMHVQSARTVTRVEAPAPTHTPCPGHDDESSAPAPPAPPAPAVRPVASVAARRAPEAVRSSVTSVTTVTAPAAVSTSTFTTPTATESVYRIAPAAVRVAFQTSFAVKTPRAVEAASAPSTAGSGGDLLDAIDDAKYPHPSVDELIALRNQGVSGDYVRRMGALHPRPSLHDLLALATQGVTSDYVAALNRRLAAEPSLGQILALRSQGVSATWLDGLGTIGYPKLSADDAIALAVQGVSVSYVRGLLDAGLRNLTPSQLLALRVQGIDGSFVRRLAAHGYHNLSIDELVRLKLTGIGP